jgi:hypothetical protein
MRAPEAERPVWCHTAPPRPQRHPRRPRHSRRPRHQQLRHHPRWLPFQARPHERPHHHRSTLEAYRRIRPGDCHPSCCPPAPLRRPPSQSHHLPDYQIGQRHHRQNCCRHSEATTHRRMRSPAKRSQRRTGNSGPTIFPTHQSARHQATPLAPRVHARPRNDGDSASEPGRRRRADFRDASSCSPPAKVRDFTDAGRWGLLALSRRSIDATWPRSRFVKPTSTTSPRCMRRAPTVGRLRPKLAQVWLSTGAPQVVRSTARRVSRRSQP